MGNRRTHKSGNEAQRTIERELEPSAFVARRRGAGPRTEADLHICPACASELVYPLEWEPAGRARWSVALRCPDCEWNGGGIYSQPVLDRFDDELDNGTDAVLEDLKAVVRQNMHEELERFVAALDADQVLPEDF